MIYGLMAFLSVSALVFDFLLVQTYFKATPDETPFCSFSHKRHGDAEGIVWR